MLVKFGWRFAQGRLVVALALCGLIGLLGQAYAASAPPAGDGVPLSITATGSADAGGRMTAASGDESIEESDLPAPAKSASPPSPVSAPAAATGDILYLVRPGDSLGEIATNFHIPLADLLKRNHLNVDSTLQSGAALHIPNPFAAQVRELREDLESTQARNQRLSRQVREAADKADQTAQQIADLTNDRQLLRREVQVLPWWRRMTAIALGAMVLMLGITGLALLEWLRMRSSFRALAHANERLRNLDEQYRRLMARAELRFQQLYGRRRAPVETSGKSPDEFEIERLRRDLKQIIETQLIDLGAPAYAPARRWRLREWLAGGSSPAVIRSGRR